MYEIVIHLAILSLVDMGGLDQLLHLALTRQLHGVDPTVQDAEEIPGHHDLHMS